MSELNQWLFQAINLSPHTAEGWIGLARFSTHQLPVVMLILPLASLATRRSPWRTLGMELLLAMALAWACARLIQQAWPMPRPFVLELGQLWIAHGASPSFPSTHASVAFAWGALAWWRMAHTRLRWWALVPPLLVAWSRVAVGVHFPIDVLAGLAVGTTSAWLVQRLRPRLLWAPAALPT